MMTEWPPTGYSEPKEYDQSERGVLAIGAILSVILFFMLRTPLRQLADPLIALLRSVVVYFGVANSVPILVMGALLLTLLFLVGVVIGFRWVVIPFHEWIHYKVNDIQNNNPEYISTNFLYLQNPAVISKSTGLTIWEYVPGAIAPFVIIGTISIIIIQTTSGFVEGIAAFILLANSAASAGDLYNAGRLLRMPPGTLFANFEQDGEYRTEYVYPEEE